MHRAAQVMCWLRGRSAENKVLMLLAMGGIQAAAYIGLQAQVSRAPPDLGSLAWLALAAWSWLGLGLVAASCRKPDVEPISSEWTRLLDRAQGASPAQGNRPLRFNTGRSNLWVAWATVPQRETEAVAATASVASLESRFLEAAETADATHLIRARGVGRDRCRWVTPRPR